MRAARNLAAEERCTIALESFVAGAYSSTYDPVGAVAATDMGVMEGGYEITAQVGAELIGETDKYGATVVDEVFRGYQSVALQCNALEYVAGVLLAAFPYATGTIPGLGDIPMTGYLDVGVVARLASAVAGAVILTATANTPAATAPATLTASKAIIHESFDVKLVFDSKLRKIPLRFRLLPFLDTQVKFFSVT